jgi:transcriptional regulator with XRE-family HTH domain
MLRFQTHRLQELRHGLGWTRAEFARRIGVSRQMIAFYEDDGYVPGTAVLARIVSVTGAKMESFFADEDDRQSVAKPR